MEALSLGGLRDTILLEGWTRRAEVERKRKRARRLWAEGELTHREIAERLGLAKSVVVKHCRGLIRQHLTTSTGASLEQRRNRRQWVRVAPAVPKGGPIPPSPPGW